MCAVGNKDSETGIGKAERKRQELKKSGDKSAVGITNTETGIKKEWRHECSGNYKYRESNWKGREKCAVGITNTETGIKKERTQECSGKYKHRERERAIGKADRSVQWELQIQRQELKKSRDRSAVGITNTETGIKKERNKSTVKNTNTERAFGKAERSVQWELQIQRQELKKSGDKSAVKKYKHRESNWKGREKCAVGKINTETGIRKERRHECSGK
ncbi:hypothetical protein CHS0354_024753 [Potamilus streckersoni]|uniref:Uncharacterized protein n=1 Tax=Potamilus streckersoni TaxID=2493646 RepID=A0AAE0RX14_9BIVA|nr:hypothetical protein CHS0354_024753 [Potamilus streckersoni]